MKLTTLRYFEKLPTSTQLFDSGPQYCLVHLDSGQSLGIWTGRPHHAYACIVYISSSGGRNRIDAKRG